MISYEQCATSSGSSRPLNWRSGGLLESVMQGIRKNSDHKRPLRHKISVWGLGAVRLGLYVSSDCSGYVAGNWSLYIFGCTFARYCAAGAVLGPLSPNRLLWHRVLNGYTPISRAIGSATIIRFVSPRLMIGYSRWLTFG